MENEYVSLEMNGFVMNAGILGFIRFLEKLEAKKNEDFYIEEDRLLVRKEFLLSKDLTKGYIDTVMGLFYDDSHHALILKRISEVHSLMEKEPLDETKLADVYSSLKIDSKNLLKSLPYLEERTGLMIKTTYEKLQKEKDFEKRYALLKEYETIMKNDEIKRHFSLASISIKVLSRIWSGIAFIHMAQGKLSLKSDKDMELLFEDEVIKGFNRYISADQKEKSKMKKICCECDASHNSSITLSILNDMMDDVNSKSSALWDYNKDLASLCPTCALAYLMSPLGFTKVGDELLFVNANASLNFLVLANPQDLFYSALKENEPVKFHNQLLHVLLKKDLAQIDNIQVIRRNASRYRFEILNLHVLRQIERSKNRLEALAKLRKIKLKSRDINVYEEVVDNILHQRHQYNLLHMLFKVSLQDSSAKYPIPFVFGIQLDKKKMWLETQSKIEGGCNMTPQQLEEVTEQARKNGVAMRLRLKEARKDSQSIVYRLLNALQSNNKHEFLNVAMRMHNSFGITLTPSFIKAINTEGLFQDMGYSYLLGLQNYPDKKEEEVKK